MTKPVLIPDDERGAMYEHGTVSYRVFLDRRWIGWVGDGAAWKGWRYGSRRWWACWRENGDHAARWSTGLDFDTRKAALDALLREVEK